MQENITRLTSHLYNFHIHYIHFHKNCVRWASQELFTCFENEERDERYDKKNSSSFQYTKNMLTK